jgi:hypothetical protein
MPQLIDMSGWENESLRVTGKKTVVNRTTGARQTLWVVCCKQCGATRKVNSNWLRTGNRICPKQCGAPGSVSGGRPRLRDYSDHESEHLRVVGIYRAGRNKGAWKCKCKHCDKIFPVRSTTFKANPSHRHACTRLKDMSDFENDFIRVIRKKRKRTKTAKNTKGALVYVALCKVCNTEYDVAGKYLREHPDASHGACKIVVDLSRFENDLIRVVKKARPTRTVSGNPKRRWIVECKQCGKQWPVPTGSLRSGNTAGCSCTQYERSAEKRKRDYSDFENVYIRVLREVAPVNYIGGYPLRRFSVLCKACGNPFECDGARITATRNIVTSCGCMTAELLSKQNQLVPRRRWSGSIFPYQHGRRRIDMRSTWEVAFAWACDFYGIRWIYEPEWFVLKKGVRFLPDFFLPDAGRYVEVKGRMSRRDLEQICLFAKDHAIVFAGRKEIASVAGCTIKVFRSLYDEGLLREQIKMCVAGGAAWNPLEARCVSRFSKASLLRHVTEQ